MKRPLLAVFVAAAVVLAGSEEAQGQAVSRGLFRPGAIELDIGGVWQAQVPLGSISAPLTGNQGPPTVDLFRTSTDIEAHPGVEARLAVNLTRVIAVEGAFRYARPQLRTTISDDFEDAPDTVAEGRFDQYAIEVTGLVHLTGLRFGSAIPFLFGGGGYLRELHEGREIVETGQTFQGGGGIKVLFSRSPRGLVRSVGIRVDARIHARRGGIELDQEEPLRTYPAAGAALVVGF